MEEEDAGLPALTSPLQPPPAPSSPPAEPGYDSVEGLPAPLQDLADARAVLPAGLALPDQGGVGCEEDAL